MVNEKYHHLDEYFARYNELIVRNLCLYVDYHTAQDLCQESFIRLAGHLDHVRPEMVKAWLLVVSERLALDYLKKGGKYKSMTGMKIEREELVDLRSDTERIAEEREESRKKLKALARLKLERREWYDALILRYVERMSDKVIGETLGIKRSLVGKQRQRAREKLREWYGEED